MSATTLQAAGDGPMVRAAVYPAPPGGGDPWSHWGQGIVTPDGRFLSAAGNHRGEEGNSWFYEFDPTSGRLVTIGDVVSLAGRQPGAWGYGKVHAQLVGGPCGEVYASTYWGDRDGLTYGNGYDGDLLLRLEPAERTTTVLGVPVPGRGLPSLAGSAARGVLYGEAVDPTTEPDGGDFFAYDLASGETIVVDSSPAHVGFRAIAVDGEGRAYFTMPAGALTRYDPATGELSQLPDPLPGEFLRAATSPAPDGTVYGVTQKPEHFIALRPDGSIDDLGEAPGYIASLAIEPDGSVVYAVPGAHGDGWEQGTPVVALDTATGEQSVVVELNELGEQHLGLTLGGTYGIALDPVSRRLFLSMNAAPSETRDDTTFGEVVLVEVTLPPVAEGGSQPASDSRVEGLVCWESPAAAEPADQSITWQDATASAGLESRLVGMMGHAAAWGDLDGDGLPDLFVGTFADRPPEDYVARGASGPRPDVVLRNNGDTFTETAALEPGRTSGAVAADLDLDGDLDLVVTRNVRDNLPTASVVLRNEGGTITPVDDAGIDPGSPGRSIGVLDVDADGLPDLVIAEDRFNGGSSRLYRNAGDLRFEPLGADAGWPDDVHGLGVGTGDLNGDGLTDIVVGGSNRVFVGTGSGVREVDGALAPWEVFGDEDDVAGVDLGDVDRDGDLDVVLGQHFNSTIDDEGVPGREVPVRLYRNDTAVDGGDPVLTDVTEQAGLSDLDTKAPHVALVDLDNDGWLDILTSASGEEAALPATLRNEGGEELQFAPAGTNGSDQYWVAAPTADVNRDGRLDTLLVEFDPALPTLLLLNSTEAGHWIEVSVNASLGGGPGTTVSVYRAGKLGDPGSLLGTDEISPTQGYSAGVEMYAHVGLGDETSVDVLVTPPAPNEPIQLRRVAVDRHLRLPDGCG
ncbi:MAG: FG-GAP-like repeat-containing protein [Actinomycetota bacterium]|nr:FG-GAP-like repeat-containing protein [Actinomycetota bacterium]